MRIRQVKCERLVPWAGNPRHNERAVQAVIRSISRFGFSVPILCNHEYRILAGHTRLEAARRLGIKSVPIVQLRLSGTEEQAFAIAENKTRELSEWDVPALKTILAELHENSIDLKDLGFTAREMRRLIPTIRESEDQQPTAIERSRCRENAMYRLGRHLLLCGDARKTKNVRLLLDGIQPNLVFAGPPYFNQREYAKWRSYARYLQDMRRVAQNAYAHLQEGGVVVWNIANGCSTHHAHVVHHAAVLEEVGFQFLDMIMWIKTGANYGVPRGGHIIKTRRYYPTPRWEALLVYQKPGEMPRMTTDGARYMWEYHTDAWEIPAVTQQVRTYGHPAVCPVEIPYRALQAYTAENGIVFEPFGGSGTTLIAAEKSDRTAYIIEIHPEYCDRIIQRWETLTGGKARRESS